MSIDYRGSVVDLLNEAKEVEAGQRLFVLEQVREILINREQSLLREFLPHVMDLSVLANTKLRRFLIKFGGGALNLDFTLLPVVLESFNFMMTDQSESVHKAIASELTKIYGRAVMAIVRGNAVDAKGSGEQVWSKLNGMVERLMNFAASPRSESVRTQALHLIEVVLLFGFPAPPKSHDPRKRRTAASTETESDLSVEDVPLHHPFIAKNELEETAEDTLTKTVLWAINGGPRGYPFSPSQMCVLGQLLSSVASRRKGKVTAGDEPVAVKAGRALVAVMQGGNMASTMAMTAAERGDLIRSVNRFLKSEFVPSSDSRGLVSELLAAIASVESLKGDEGSGASKKRKAATSVDKEAAAADEAEEETTRASAVAALDSLESEIKRAKHEEAGREREAAASSSSSTPGAVAETELASQFAGKTEAPTRLMKIVAGGKKWGGSGSLSMKPVIQSEEATQTLVVSSLVGLLENFASIRASNREPAALAHKKLCVRATLSLAGVDIAENRNQVAVEIVSALPALQDEVLLAGAPVSVQLPRSVWLLISFALDLTESQKLVPGLLSAKQQHLQLVDITKSKLSFLMMMLREVCEREQACVEAMKEVEAARCRDLYDSASAAILGRLLQNVQLREFIRPFFMLLPRFPHNCLSLLRLLAYTGTKGSPTISGGRGAARDRNRGTKLEALSLLSSVVFCDDQEASYSGLCYLLWCTVSEDVDIRLKAVTVITDEILNRQAWVYDTVCRFALQAAAQVPGIKAVMARAEICEAARAAEWPGDKRKEEEKEGAMDVDGDGEGADEAKADVEEEKKEEEGPRLHLSEVLADYDEGETFQGSFANFLPPLSLAAGEAVIMSYSRRAFHLMSQLCVRDYTLLGAILDLAGAGISAKVEGDDAADGTADKGSVFMSSLRGELATILPAVVVHSSTDSVFDCLARSDPAAAPLLEHSLAMLHTDLNVPATEACTQKVRAYLRSKAPEGGSEDTLTDAELAFCEPLLGGFSEEMAKELLPRLLSTHKANTGGALNDVFSRLCLCTPPAMTKARLLAHLHRLDVKSAGLSQKEQQDIIGLCLNREDFRGDTVKDALLHLLEDAVPCRLLMRTAIISSQKHPDVRRYVLMEVIPRMVRKKVWSLPETKDIWVGVCHAVKLLAGHKDAEPALRALFGLPGPQLKEVARVAKEPLSKFLKLLSTKEKAEVLSGRWAGIEQSGADKDKEELVKMLER